MRGCFWCWWLRCVTTQKIYSMTSMNNKYKQIATYRHKSLLRRWSMGKWFCCGQHSWHEITIQMRFFCCCSMRSTVATQDSFGFLYKCNTNYSSYCEDDSVTRDSWIWKQSRKLRTWSEVDIARLHKSASCNRDSINSLRLHMPHDPTAHFHCDVIWVWLRRAKTHNSFFSIQSWAHLPMELCCNARRKLSRIKSKTAKRVVNTRRLDHDAMLHEDSASEFLIAIKIFCRILSFSSFRQESWFFVAIANGLIWPTGCVLTMTYKMFSCESEWHPDGSIAVFLAFSFMEKCSFAESRKCEAMSTILIR